MEYLNRLDESELIEEIKHYTNQLISKDEFIREYDGSIESFEDDFKKINIHNKEIYNKIIITTKKYLEVTNAKRIHHPSQRK